MNRTATHALRMLLEAQPATAAKAIFAWKIAAGPALSRAAIVEWRNEGASGVLSVRPRTDAWRQALQQAHPVLLQRLHELLGPGALARLDIN